MTSPTPTPSISFQNTPSTGLAGEIFSIPLPSAIHSTLLSDLLSDIFSLSPTSPSSSYIPPNVIIPLMIDRTSDRALSTIAAWLTHNTPVSPPVPTTSPSPAPFSGSRPASVLSSSSSVDEDDLTTPFPAWEHTLLDVPYPRLFEVMIAANYLGMERLGRQAAQVVGERLRGLTAVQIRRVLCIEEESMSQVQGGAGGICEEEGGGGGEEVGEGGGEARGGGGGVV